MSFLKKLFSCYSKVTKDKNNSIIIYIDAELRRGAELPKDQTVKQYQRDQNFEDDQYLYLLIFNKKIGQIVLKRKLNPYERLSECLVPPSEDCRCYLVIGNDSQCSRVPKISPNIPLVETMRFIRSGTLAKYSDLRNGFEDCHIKLHHDYLTFYRSKQTEKKVSFMPLENSKVQIINEKKCIFSVRDKFNCTKFKTRSKEDMYSWLIAITRAIKIRNSQIYMNEMEEKMQKILKNKVSNYINKFTNLKGHQRLIPLDDLGRKALKAYFRKNTVEQKDTKLLSVIEAYLHMCKTRREKGELHSEQIYMQIKQILQEMDVELLKQLEIRDLDSKNEFVKTIEEIMKYLDSKYRKELIDRRNIYSVFESYILEQYIQDQRIPVKTLMRKDPDL